MRTISAKRDFQVNTMTSFIWLVVDSTVFALYRCSSWIRLIVFGKTVKYYISEQMFVNHCSASQLTFREYHKLFLFFVLVATAYWSPLPITPLIKKSYSSQLTSLMLSSNFVCGVLDYKNQIIYTE